VTFDGKKKTLLIFPISCPFT